MKILIMVWDLTKIYVLLDTDLELIKVALKLGSNFYSSRLVRYSINQASHE